MPHRRLLAAGTEGRDSASTANLLNFDASLGFDEKHDMKFAGSPVTVTFSQSSDLFAIAADRMVHLKTLDASQPSGTKPHSYVRCDKDIQSLAFNPDADHLAITTGRTCALYRVRPGDLRLERTIKIDPAARSLAFSPDGMLLAVGREDGVVQLYGPRVCRI
jgi:WD40 repeat protein